MRTPRAPGVPAREPRGRLRRAAARRADRRAGTGFVTLALAVALVLAAAPAAAQVFLASRPNPEFAVGPLFVRASIDPRLGPVTVDVLWSLAVPAGRSALGLEQDLYLLWPAEVRHEGAAAPDRELVEYVQQRGFEVVGTGGLPLSVQDLYPPPGARSIERPVGAAPYVTFRRGGLAQVGLRPGATLVRIPWTPDLVNRVRMLRLQLRLDGAIRPKRASWVEELLRGRRHLISVSYNNVRSAAVFGLYHENRERVVPLASEPSQLLVRFAEADRLRIDEVTPASAVRESRDRTPPRELVSMYLDPAAEGVPQVLTVQFGYASGLQAWAPVLIPLAFFILGRATGPLIERVVRQIARSVSARVRFGAGVDARQWEQGALVSRETLQRIVPGQTTAEEVLALCGRDGVEEEERLGDPDRRTLVYRGRRVLPKPQHRFAWFLATVSHWELEDQQVEIALERGVVRDVRVRLRRAHLPYPDSG